VERYVLTLDLDPDPRKIAAYERHHRRVWPEVVRSLRRVGVRRMDIYRMGARLAMILEVKDGFDRRRDFAAHVASDPRCAEWEALMKTLQRRAPGAARGEWWALMKPVFHMDPKRADGGRWKR
jgi:L-rhamnose mutarotase